MCMFDHCDGTSVVLHAREQKARKEHQCTECSRTIAKGEIYLAERCVFEGSANSYKTCRHCLVVRDWLSAECGGFVYQGVAEDIHEHVLEGYGFGVVRLDAGMSKGWRRKDGRLWPIPQMPSTTHQKMAA